MSIERIHGRAAPEVREAVRAAAPPAVAPETGAGEDPGDAAPEVEDDAVKISLSSSAARGHAYGVAKKLQRVDTDGDQSLNREELEAAVAARGDSGKGGNLIARILQNYDRLDADHDGSLSYAEMHPRLVAKAQEAAAAEVAEPVPVTEPAVEDPATGTIPPVTGGDVPLTGDGTSTAGELVVTPEVPADPAGAAAEVAVTDSAAGTLLTDAETAANSITEQIVADAAEPVPPEQRPDASVT